MSLFKDQKDWERYSDKTFNWLFAKYVLFDIKAVKQLDVSGLNDVKINTENIDKVIAFYKKLDKIDLDHKKL